MVRRVISIFVLLTMVSADPIFPHAVQKPAYGNMNLAPVSNNNPLAESVPNSSAEFVRAAIATQMIMSEMSRIAYFEGTETVDTLLAAYRKIEAYGHFPSGIDFRLMTVTPYFYEISHLEGKDFLLPVSLSRPRKAVRIDLHLVVNTVPRNGIFPIRLATPEEIHATGLKDGEKTKWEKGSIIGKLDILWWEMVEFTEDEINTEALREFIRENEESVAVTELARRIEAAGADIRDMENISASLFAEVFNEMIKEEDLYVKLKDATEVDLEKKFSERYVNPATKQEDLWWFNRGEVVGAIYPVKKLRRSFFERFFVEEKYIRATRRMATILKSETMPSIGGLHRKGWFAIALSRLYAFGDYQFVIDLVHKAQNMENKKDLFRRIILNSPEILVLYLAALIISPESGLEGKEEKMDFIDKHMGFFFRKMDYESRYAWTDSERQSIFDQGANAAAKLAEIAHHQKYYDIVGSIVDEVEDKIERYKGDEDLKEQLKLIVLMYSYGRLRAKRELRRERAARKMAREAAFTKGSADRALFDEYREEAERRLELYLRRAVSHATGTYEKTEPTEKYPEGEEKISFPREVSELGDEIVVGRPIPEELDAEVRQDAIMMARNSKILEKLKIQGIAKSKAGEKTKVVVDIADDIQQKYPKTAKKQRTDLPLDFLEDTAYFKLFERYVEDYLSPDPYANLEIAMDEIPQEFWRHGFDRVSMADKFLEIRSEAPIDIPLALEKGTAMIFSEKVTFDNGLGVLLGKLARSGVNIAVIATTDRQRGLIQALNRDILREEHKIKYAESVAEVHSVMRATRYYYFKVEGDPDAVMSGITTFDITDIVDRIIETIGALTGIVRSEKIQQLYNAARAFAEAA